MKIELSKEYTFGAKKYKSLEIDIETLTGKEFLQCEKEFKVRFKDPGAIKELEDGWALTVAAKTLNLKYGDLLTLSGTDYLKVVNRVKLFLSKGWDEKDSVGTILKTEDIGV